MANKTIDHAISSASLTAAASDPTHAGVLSFMRRRYTKTLKGASTVVWGIPFDAATSNRPGARFGPHVNASTSFDETIYMLDVPTDKPGYVDRGLLALHDFAAGISLLQEEVDKERGVVIEEWRGRLGAGSTPGAGSSVESSTGP